MKKVIIVDASGWMYRSFYGKPEDPVSGLKFLIDIALDLHKPDESIVCYDHGKETHRTAIYPRYKTERKPTPPEYIALVPAFKNLFAEYGFKALSVPGFEADDLIGSVCAKLDTYQRVILTRDKDFMQLVTQSDGDESVCLCHDDKFVHFADVVEKFGVYPELVVDVLGLMGDATDSIPGCAGIGQKTASKLVAEYGKLENIYDNIEGRPHYYGKPQPISDKIRMLLKVGKEAAFLSRELATIKCDVEVEL